MTQQPSPAPSAQNPDIELQSLFKIQYGMYVISSVDGNKLNGQIATTVMQVTNEPVKLTACLSKDTLTHDMIMKSRVFGISVLDTKTTINLIGCFGFHSGRDYDKFEHVPYTIGATGCPLLKKNTLANIEVRVTEVVDIQTHTLFIGDVVTASEVAFGSAMTYEYYHKELKGRSPKNAPTYHVSQAVSHQPDKK